MREYKTSPTGDLADQAQATEAIHTQASISNIVRYTGVSAKNCVECGDEIPEGRRQAVSGSTTCIECENEKEKRNKHYWKRH